MRRSDPVRDGEADSTPMSTAPISMDSFKRETMGPKAETPANPAKNASVVQVRAALRLDWA